MGGGGLVRQGKKGIGRTNGMKKGNEGGRGYRVRVALAKKEGVIKQTT